jgi:HlyD family secretion protein
MKKAKIVPLAAVLAIVGLSGAGLWWWMGRGPHPADQLVLHGNVDIRQVQLAFNDSGRIEQMLVQEGAQVGKGQLLAVLDMTRLQHQVDQEQGQVAAQRQVVAALEAGTRPEEIRRDRAAVEAAAAQAQNAQRSYERTRQLAEQHFLPKQQLDDARTAADAALAQLKAARETLALAVAGPRKEDIAAARATLKALEAALALGQRELADASLYAPGAGVVQDRLMEPGDMASPQQPVYTIALTDPLWVRAYVSEPELGKVRLGMRAEASTDSYPGKRYRGWVGFISPTAEFTPKTVETAELRTSLVYQVRVYVCNPRGELRLGMPATVTIPLQPPPAAPSAEPCAGS